MLQVLALALAYYVAARLALLMAIPPGYAAAVWPAAGIGLVAIMVWGKRVWPGIVLGSYLGNSAIPAGLAAGMFSQQSWIALGIATGAALQALIGGVLVRRQVNPTSVFAREMELAKLLFLAGPVACVVSASTGVAILYLAGVVSASDVAFHWWTWWVGDTIGVMLVVPVFLTWTASPEQMSLWRKIQLSIPLTALGALVVLVFVYTSAMEQQRLQAEFSRRTEQLTRALAQDVRGYTDVLEAIGDLYASEPEVGREQFATFVRRSLAERPGIQALSWNPRIAEEERAGFEASARADGYSGFQITELAADGHLQPAARRAWYVPIRDIEPYADNHVALGFDVASDPDRLTALQAARDSGRSTATGSITLVQAAGHPYGFLLALPVYGHGKPTATLAQRRQSLRGYAVAAFRMEALMAAFLRGQDTTGLRIRLLDIGAPKAGSLLYQLGAPATAAETSATDVDEARIDAASLTPADSFARRKTLVVGGRRLALHFALTPEYLHTQRSWLAWTVLAIGLLFTGLLGAFLLIIAGRAGLIENIVVQRTTQLRLANEALEQSRRGLAENELRLQEAQKIAQVGSWEWDPTADEISWSEELRRIYGAGVDSLRPSYASFLEYTHPDDRQRVDAAVRRAMASRQPFGFEHRILRADGTVRTIQAHGRVVGSESGEPSRVLGTAQDITELKDAEQHLLQLAHFDALTGLPNRALFCKTLADALAQARKQGWVISVLFLDLDRFKNINDTLGHACGDALLRQLAGRLADTLRVRDTVARFGGDEFSIMLINADDQHNAATIVADKLREALRAPFHLDGHEVTVTASIGATVFPADSDEADVLIKYADTAMYAAKEAGRDTYRFYTAAMNADVVRRLALETALRRALERDEFVLHYQPKLDIGSGEWTGVEALLRWNRPGHGLVPPGDFIPLLEETGLIEPVGAWVINAACRQIAEWAAAGMAPMPIAVNVSVKQLLRGLDFEPFGTAAGDSVGTDSSALERTVEAALRKHGVAPHLLEIELTESTLMLNAAKTVELLQRLRTMGLQIAIDDFGTGYSSLAYLKRFSASIIKIDQTFIRDIAIDSDDAAIAAAIIIMAHSLRLRVIAEGVETAEQLTFLREQGCDEAQGYLLARPMPAEACAQVLRTRLQLVLPGDLRHAL